MGGADRYTRVSVSGWVWVGYASRGVNHVFVANGLGFHAVVPMDWTATPTGMEVLVDVFDVTKTEVRQAAPLHATRRSDALTGARGANTINARAVV